MIADLGMYSGYMDRTEQDATFAACFDYRDHVGAGLFEASFLQGVDNFMTSFRAGATGAEVQC